MDKIKPCAKCIYTSFSAKYRAVLLLAGIMFIYVEKPKDLEEYWKKIGEFSKLAGYTINI